MASAAGGAGAAGAVRPDPAFPGAFRPADSPLVALGSRLSERTQGEKESIGSAALLGVATGLLWAPCAGPILGIIFTTAAIQGASLDTTFLLLAYALGAATSLALALLVGGKLFARMKRSLGASERIRQAVGLLVLVGVAAIALGLDTRVLAKFSTAQTAGIETGLAKKLGLGKDMAESAATTDRNGRLVLPVEGQMPPLEGLGPWINSPPLTARAASRQGRADRLLDLQLHQLPAHAAVPQGVERALWQGRAGDHRRPLAGVRLRARSGQRPQGGRRPRHPLSGRARQSLHLWNALKNNYWPAHYFFDAQGRIRYHHFGEGEYDMSERVIRQLLAEAGHAPAGAMTSVSASGAAGGGGSGRGRIAGDLRRLLPRRAFRVARRPAA